MLVLDFRDPAVIAAHNPSPQPRRDPVAALAKPSSVGFLPH
jgi:hypothetical protein